MSEYEEVKPITEEEVAGVNIIASDGFKYDALEIPHWLFERAILLNSMQLLAIAVKEGSDQVSSLVELKPIAGTPAVELTANTGDILVRSVVPILNEAHILEGCYHVDFKVLFGLVKNGGNKLVLKAVNDAPVVMTLGGEAELDQFTVADEVFNQPVLDTQGGFSGSYESVDFLNVLSRVSASMALAQTVESKKVKIDAEGTAYCNFISSLFRAVGSPVKGISLRAIDVQILQKLLTPNPTFLFKELEEGYLFKTERECVVLRKWKAENAEGIQDYFIQAENWFNLDPNYTSKIVGLMKDRLGSMGVMRMKTEDTKLIFTAKTRNSKQLQFPVTNILPPGIEFNILCPVQVVSAMLSLFKDEAVMKVSVKENKVQFSTDKIEVVFGSCM